MYEKLRSINRALPDTQYIKNVQWAMRVSTHKYLQTSKHVRTSINLPKNSSYFGNASASRTENCAIDL